MAQKRIALTNIQKLNNNQLIELLERSGYEEFSDTIREKNVNGDEFMNLSEFDLTKWKLGPNRTKLWICITNMRDNPESFIQISKTAVPKRQPSSPSVHNATREKLERVITNVIPENIRSDTFPKIMSNSSATSSPSNVYVSMDKTVQDLYDDGYLKPIHLSHSNQPPQKLFSNLYKSKEKDNSIINRPPLALPRDVEANKFEFDAGNVFDINHDETDVVLRSNLAFEPDLPVYEPSPMTPDFTPQNFGTHSNLDSTIDELPPQLPMRTQIFPKYPPIRQADFMETHKQSENYIWRFLNIFKKNKDETKPTLFEEFERIRNNAPSFERSGDNNKNTIKDRPLPPIPTRREDALTKEHDIGDIHGQIYQNHQQQVKDNLYHNQDNVIASNIETGENNVLATGKAKLLEEIRSRNDNNMIPTLSSTSDLSESSEAEKSVYGNDIIVKSDNSTLQTKKTPLPEEIRVEENIYGNEEVEKHNRTITIDTQPLLSASAKKNVYNDEELLNRPPKTIAESYEHYYGNEIDGKPHPLVGKLPMPPQFIPDVPPRDFDHHQSDEDDGETEVYGKFLFSGNLNDEPFYRNTDRKGARELLRHLDDGAFLFRPSKTYFLTLTIKYQSRTFNLGIDRGTNNKIRCHSEDANMSPEFSTLNDFAEYFSTHVLTFEHDNSVVEIYLRPVLPSHVF